MYGPHTFEANVAFLEGALDHLRSGGILRPARVYIN
jgi:hypothetical protein